MNRLKLIPILFLFLILIFSTNVFSLTYRADVDNGTWSQYDLNLSSTFKQVETTGQTTYNRGFETTIGTLGNGTDSCAGGWCVTFAGDAGETAVSSNDFAQEGTYSLKMSHPAGTNFYTTSETEKVGDSNVTFYYRHGSADHLRVGYMDDTNTVTQVFDLAQTAGVWVKKTFKVPHGNYRITFYFDGGGAGGDFYVDDIRVLRNNTGTFRKTTVPQYCNSLESCSNTEFHLPALQSGNLYYAVEFVAGASCSYRLNKPLSQFGADGTGTFTADGTLTEGTSGMYYMPVNTSVLTNDYIDVNIEVYCIKAPSVKGFFISPRIYKYGNVENGSFETTVTKTGNGAGDGCSGNWCIVNSEANEYIQSTSSFSQDGINSLLMQYAGGSLATVYNETTYYGGTTVSFYVLDPSNSAHLYAGYVNDAEAFTQLLDIPQQPDWNYWVMTIPAGSYRVAFQNQVDANPQTFKVDNISSSGALQTSTMTPTNTLTSNYGLKGTSYSFYSTFVNEFSNSITDATCALIVDGVSTPMPYDAGNSRYSTTYTFTANGAYTIRNTCGQASYNDGNSTYTATITTPASQIITFTPIQNSSNYTLSDFSPVITINPTNNDDIIFKVINLGTTSNMTFNWQNSPKTANKQYSIYTSTDGTNWVFSDSLTFGSSATYNDPVQKTALATTDKYSFTDSLPNATPKYYKFIYNTLPLAWGVIANSADWVNTNQPTIYTDANNNAWDVFADSNYTPINSYTSKRFPDLTTADLNSGFELQFTAYASKNNTLKVGYVVDSTQTTFNISVTTTPQRFSIPIDPTSNEARLLIKSDGNNAQVYLTNYAIVPKAYFTGRLEVLNIDRSPLNSILISGTSNKYIREAIPFIIQTSAYDKDADLQRLTVQAMIGTVVIKTQDFLLTDATKKDKVFVWDELIEGFVDYDGNAVLPSGLRSVLIKATLYNTAGKSVSEQTATVKILQYPYFQSDITFDIYSLAGKVGENPSVRLNLNQKDPSQLIGTKIYIYDKNHSVANPNYSETVLNNVLGCTTFICSKDLVITDYVYEQATQYKLGVQLLLKTEYDSVQNPLTFKIFNQQVTYRAYDTARILQVFERTDHNYRNDERIQLVLQLRDVPYKDLSGDTTVYITVDTCANATGDPCAVGATKFYPKKFIYDQTTGYNYFFFDQLFYTDAGNLLYDQNFVRFQATIVDKYNAHNLADVPTATLADKCQSASYGTLFNNGWFNMNFWDNLISASQRALYGCGSLTDAIVVTGDAQEARLFIDADHNVVGGQNQSIACVKPDNENFQNTLEQDLICGVLWNKNEQPIDKFVFTIGNENSDYSKTKDSAQYLTFEIPAEQLIFSDSFMLQQGLNAEYSTDSIDTVGEVFFYGIDKLFSGVANSLTEIPEGVTKAGIITNFGFDVNWSNQLNPNYIKGIFFFKVKGLKVINQYDYIDQFPELEQTNPKYFREFANQKKIKLPIDKTLVNFYTNNLANWSVMGAQIDSMEVISPLVIYAKPSYVQTTIDTNKILVATILKFDLISDMLSNNQTTVQRLYLPLTFSYVVPKATGLAGLLNDILYGKDSFGNPAGLFTNPVGFGFKNWFWFLLGTIGILILSLIVRNFRTGGGGGFNLPVISPFLDGRNKYRKGR